MKYIVRCHDATIWAFSSFTGLEVRTRDSLHFLCPYQCLHLFALLLLLITSHMELGSDVYLFIHYFQCILEQYMEHMNTDWLW